MIPGDHGAPGAGDQRVPRPARPVTLDTYLANIGKEMRRSQRKMTEAVQATTTYDGGVVVYTVTGEGTITTVDLPAGVYAAHGDYSVTYSTASTDQYARVEISSSTTTIRGTLAGPSAGSGFAIVAAAAGVLVISEDDSIILTPTLGGGPGGAYVTAEVTTLTATRLGPA